MSRSYLLRAQRVLVVLGALSFALPALLTIPYFQKHALYLHYLRWPFFADFQTPGKYGMPVHRTVNVRIETSDKVHLGAWLLVPEHAASNDTTANLLPTRPLSPSDLRASLAVNPTILYFHGNAATRAVSFRVHHYVSYATKFSANVLVIDYRGFADSEGSPSEEGLQWDARAAWDWVAHEGASAKDVLIVGQSLGTGVAAGLAAELATEDIHPRGVVLLAPFTSIEALLVNYNMFGFLPLMKPLEFIPYATKFFTKFLRHRFDSASVLHMIKAPIMLAHSHDDFDIPYFHSQNLFNALLDPLLPPLPALPSSLVEMTSADWSKHNEVLEKRRSRRAQIVATQEVENFGKITKFERESGSAVVFVETNWGGHNRIGIQESVMDLMQCVFRL